MTLAGTAVLSVQGKQLNDAWEGGSIDIETRGANGGVLDIGAGRLYLGVGTGSSIFAAGTVHVRAPLLTGAPGSGATILATVDPDTAQGTDATAGGIAIDSITPGNINDAGSVVVEGYRVYQPSSGTIDAAVESAVTTDVANFPTGAIAMQLGVNGNALNEIEPGAEIINPSGDLTLVNNWDLSSVRTDAGLPGVLTIRASGNLIFDGSLTDGFAENANGLREYLCALYLGRSAGTIVDLPAGCRRLVHQREQPGQFRFSGATGSRADRLTDRRFG